MSKGSFGLKAYLKIGLIVALTVVTMIIILQNTESVETRLLFVTMTMPRALLLLITLLIGFGTGLTTSLMLARSKKKPE